MTSKFLCDSGQLISSLWATRIVSLGLHGQSEQVPTLDENQSFLDEVTLC